MFIRERCTYVIVMNAIIFSYKTTFAGTKYVHVFSVFFSNDVQ